MKQSQQTQPNMIESLSSTTQLTSGEATMKKLNLQQFRSLAVSALMLGGAYVVANILGAHDAFAQNATALQGAITNVGKNIGGAANVVYTASYIGGTTALAMGAFKLKAHAENPSQTPLQQGVSRLAVGAGLIAMPAVGNILSTTVSNGNTSGLTSQQGQINVTMP